jgi:hypothetical protein
LFIDHEDFTNRRRGEGGQIPEKRAEMSTKLTSILPLDGTDRLAIGRANDYDVIISDIIVPA